MLIFLIVPIEIIGIIRVSEIFPCSHSSDIIEAFLLFGFCFSLCFLSAILLFTIIGLTILFYKKDVNYLFGTNYNK